MAREVFFVASTELISNVIAKWRSADATFVRPTHIGQSGALLACPEADLTEGSSVSFFVYDLPAASLKLCLETVKTDDGELKTVVQQLYGSPHIDIHFVKERTIEDKVVAGHGSLAIYPHYYDIDTNEKVKPSGGLLALFGSAVRHIRNRSNVGRSAVAPKAFLVERGLYERGAGPWFDYRMPPKS